MTRRARILFGVLLAGMIGPALGISANSDHMWGKIVAAVCFSLVGTALILHGIFTSKGKGSA